MRCLLLTALLLAGCSTEPKPQGVELMIRMERVDGEWRATIECSGPADKFLQVHELLHKEMKVIEASEHPST